MDRDGDAVGAMLDHLEPVKDGLAALVMAGWVELIACFEEDETPARWWRLALGWARLILASDTLEPLTREAVAEALRQSKAGLN